MKKIVFTVMFLCAVMAAFAGGKSDSAAGGVNNWPSKTIQVYIPWGTGGDTDLHGRVLSELVAKELGATIVCANMPGTSGTVAARHVMDSPNDGYTILWSQTTFLIASMLGISEFDYTNFETAATVIEDSSNFLVVNKKIGKFKSIQEFADYGKAHPGEIVDGIEVGSDAHLYSLLVSDQLGIKVNRVDVGGTATKIPALISGNIDCAAGVYGTYKPYIDSGDFQVLVTFSPERINGLEDVPTMKEITGKDFGLSKMFGYWFPKGTDPAIVAKFAEAARRAVNSSEFKAHCEKYFITPIARTGNEAKTYLDDQYKIMNNYKAEMFN